METQHTSSVGSGPAPPLRSPSGWPPPSWPAQPERTAELHSTAEGRPPPRFWGSEQVEKIRSRLCARRMRIAIRCVRWGRSAGARCETRRRRACVRRVGCKIYTCSPAQTATLPEGVRNVMGRAEARGGSLCVHRRRRGALCMRLWRMRGAPFRRCVVQVGRAVHLFGRCCGV